MDKKPVFREAPPEPGTRVNDPEAARLDAILARMAAEGGAWGPAPGEKVFLEEQADSSGEGILSRAAALSRRVHARLGADPDLFRRPEWEKLPDALATHAFASLPAGLAEKGQQDRGLAVLELLAGTPPPEILAALGRSLAADSRLDGFEWRGKSLAQIIVNEVWEARTLYREAYPPEAIPPLDFAWEALKSEFAWDRPEGIRSRLLLPMAALSGFLPADPAAWFVTGKYVKLNGTPVRLSVLAAAIYSGHLEVLPEEAADLQLEPIIVEESSLSRRRAPQLPRHAATAFLFCGSLLGENSREDLGPEAVRGLIAGNNGPGYLRRVHDQAERHRDLILKAGFRSRAQGALPPLAEIAQLSSKDLGGRQSAVALGILLVLADHPELLSVTPDFPIAEGVLRGCKSVADVAERFLFPCVALWHHRGGLGRPETFHLAPLLPAAAGLLGRAESRGIPQSAGHLPERLTEILLSTFGSSKRAPLEEAIRSAMNAAVAAQGLFGAGEPGETPVL